LLRTNFAPTSLLSRHALATESLQILRCFAGWWNTFAPFTTESSATKTAVLHSKLYMDRDGGVKW
jgi:hypothetical protein